MGALAHLIPAQEVHGSLGLYPTSQTEGATWRWDQYDLVDANGALIPQATIATFVCDCKVYDTGGVVVAEPVFTATGPGAFSLQVDDSLTVDLAGTAPTPRIYRWAMSLSDGTDTVQFWTTANSPFAVHHSETH